ncbi:sulfite exporter TauE/SafE family protein [Marinobacter sp. M216]|uniref:Probable membrane transporter protein n=1 Tax=Marinobacter albus TaxID=3030833 RepID=A0ABT7HC73_9GAMM|nr:MULTISPECIES: sulfite exporter TauE/SafE family protein [unclassified Marinobacter]MBW7470255.1 sulfite exporter TauE/SafE family protein [Marinobacter sp. F4218]MDK9557480.1 sulfite exporter TauE/SafE family protein [Marinobacter sp. M216]
MTLLEMLALMALGGIAGFINVLSAGGSMLTLPLLMFLGLPPQVANGTNRVAITLQSITAVGSFSRMGHGNLLVSLRLAVPAVLGSLLGAWVATWVPDAVFQVVLVSAMIGASVFMLLPQPALDTRPLTTDRLSPAIYVAMFFVGMYGGFIQVGVGVLFIVVLYHMLKIDLRQVNVLKVSIVLPFTFAALVVFAINDQVRWGVGLTLALGNVTGAFIATRVNMSKQGARWVKAITLVMVAAILVRLILY